MSRPNVNWMLIALWIVAGLVTLFGPLCMYAAYHSYTTYRSSQAETRRPAISPQRASEFLHFLFHLQLRRIKDDVCVRLPTTYMTLLPLACMTLPFDLSAQTHLSPHSLRCLQLHVSTLCNSIYESPSPKPLTIPPTMKILTTHHRSNLAVLRHRHTGHESHPPQISISSWIIMEEHAWMEKI